MSIHDSNPIRFASRVNKAIASGATVTKMSTAYEWVSWRYILIYRAETERKETLSLTLTYGPVTERTLPECGQNED